MSTNDYSTTGINEFRRTVFTNERGRIIDFVNILNFEKHSLIFCSEDTSGKLKEHLEKYIITDDVIIEQFEIAFKQFIFFTDNPEGLLNTMFQTEIYENKFAVTDTDIFFFSDDYRVKSAIVLVPYDKTAGFEKKLTGFELLTDGEYELFRIINCISEDSRELNEEINPLEIRLNNYISFTKGCYIGQEVIARLDSQNKIPKQVVYITSESEINTGMIIFTGGEMTECGFITSSIRSGGKWHGLGFIKSVKLSRSQEYLSGKETKFSINIQNFK